MTKRFYIGTACIIFIALVALLVYSLDRTSWLLAQYELSQPDTLAHWLGLSPLALGTSSALVIEVGLIALVAGEVLASAHPEIKRYALAGLLIGLAVQAVANLIAGYLRGYQAVYDDLVTHQVSANLSWYVAGLSWLLSSLAVPGLIFILSRLAALTIRLAVERPDTTTKLALEPLQERSEPTKPPIVPSDAPLTPALDQSADEVAPPFTLADLLMTPLETEQFFDEVLEPKRKMTMADLEALTDVVLPGESQAVINGHRYECPHCGAPVKSKQARGAAVKNGYCLTCKKVQA